MAPLPEEAPNASSVTAVADVRTVPLGRMSRRGSGALTRIVPPAQTPKPPVAAFDSAL